MQHQWFNTEQVNGNNFLDVAGNMEEMDDAMRSADYKGMGKAELDLLTCTPVLAGRKLGPFVPESPFLTSGIANRDATPQMNGVNFRGNGDSAPIKIGGIVINRPGLGGNPTAVASGGSNPLELQ